MEDILKKLGMEALTPRFNDEKILPGMVCKLSKFELKSLGLHNPSDFMKLRVECIKYGTQNTDFGNNSFKKQYDISKDIIENLVEAGFSVLDMSRILSVSESTVYRRMRTYNITKRCYTDIDDEQLDLVLVKILSEFPRCGEQMLRCLLQDKGIKITRSNLRDALGRIDGDGTRERTKNRLHRRIYSVEAPNHIWHVDTNHKLIRWNFIISGGIDGFSRFVVFLNCVNNNKADTVFSCFKTATDQYGTPLRVRSDQGLENFKIPQYMIESRGRESSMIVGKNTHNQRIERLWRDVFEGALSFFYDLFYHLEDQGLLDPLNDLDLFALHHVYFNKINNNLQMWRSAWNNHKVRTIKSSPSSLFTAGLINTPISQEHNIEIDASEDIDQQEDRRPMLFPPEFVISEEHQQELLLHCPTNWDSSNYGIDVYERAKTILSN